MNALFNGVPTLRLLNPSADIVMVGVAGAMGPAVIVPLTGTGAVASCTFDAGMVDGQVTVTVLALAVVGVPSMLMATIVEFTHIAVPAFSPAGKSDTAKLLSVMLDA